MKFSLAIIALLGATSAIKIREEPAAAAAAPADAAAAPAEAAPVEAAPAPPSDDGAAQAAAAPPAPLTKAKGIVDDALKTEDTKSEEAALAAGQPVNIKNAPEAVEAPAAKVDAEGKVIEPTPLSDAEKLRNHVIRIATVGQEAIRVNDRGVQDVADKYAPKEEVKEEGLKNDAEGAVKAAQDETLEANKAAEGKSAEIEGSGITKGEAFTANMPNNVLGGINKKPILQTTVVY
jgi:hypothetical protein